MAYTDPATLTFATNENPLASAKLNNATNNQFLAAFPNGVTSVDWDPTLFADGGGASVSAVDGQRYQMGAMLDLFVRFTISAVGSGPYYVELPEPAIGIDSGQVIGSVFAQDTSSSANNEVGVALLASGTPQIFRFAFPGGNASASHPFSFTTGDFLSAQLRYPIA